MMVVNLRPARPADAPTIAEIYNQGIEDREATLETERRSAEERLRWLTGRDSKHPVIVAEVEGVVTGWGSLNVFNSRPAYDHVADFSVYVGRGYRGKGVGSALLRELLGIAHELGYHKLVLTAFPWNRGGLALYGKFGFRVVGTYREQGRLDGKWVDTILMEKIVDR